MKDALELKDYREKFKRYYGLSFSKDYHIHHIDLDHSNNDIENLMIVPKELHEVYHECLVNVQMLTEGKGTSRLFEFDVKPTGNISGYKNFVFTILLRFMKVLEEMNNWHDYKLYLEGKMPNYHGITLH